MASGAPAFEREVQTWIRQHAIAETNRNAARFDQRLLLIFDGDDLAAVGSHAVIQIDDQPGRLLVAGAVSITTQGATLSSGTRASDALIEVLLNDIQDRDASEIVLVAAKVDYRNVRSLRLCDRMGMTTEERIGETDLVLRVGLLSPRPTEGPAGNSE